MPAGELFTAILVGTDGSAPAEAAVDHAIALAAALEARLVIVSAYEPVPKAAVGGVPVRGGGEVWNSPTHEAALSLLAAAAERARTAGVAQVESDARQGHPADAIIDVAEEKGADLIVIGHQGLRGAQRFLLGSVSTKVSHHAPCSVLIVRAA